MDFANRILAKSLIITAVVALIAVLLYSRDAMVAVIAGGVVAAVNFRLSSRLLGKIIIPGMEPDAGKAMAIVSFMFRYILLGFVLYAVIRSGINPVFFIIGLSAVVGAVFVSMAGMRRGTA